MGLCFCLKCQINYSGCVPGRQSDVYVHKLVHNLLWKMKVLQAYLMSFILLLGLWIEAILYKQ